LETKNKKIVLEKIPVNRTYKNDKVIDTVLSHTVQLKKVNDIIEEGTEDLTFAEAVKNYPAFEKRNFSDQQVQFAFDAARIITGELKEKKPILVPVRCGFGKSTFINAIVLTILNNLKLKGEPIEEAGIIIVTERLEDLKQMQALIQERMGLYDHQKRTDDKGRFYDFETPYMYILESWNLDINCAMRVKNYEESLNTCPTCQFKSDCKIGNQIKMQYNSPILGITTPRFNYYADNGNLNAIGKWRGINKKTDEKTTLARKLILIDEKPRLAKVDDVSRELVDRLIDTVSRIEEHEYGSFRADKKKMKAELRNVRNKIDDLITKYEKYKNAYVKLNEEVFSKEFLELWNIHLKFVHKKHIDAIIDMFSHGAIFCKTGKYDLFKTIGMSNFIVDEYKTMIFDGTAELTLEYDKNDFILWDVNDYREYNNVTFHNVKENYSKRVIEENIEMLNPVAEWIEKNLKEKTFVVTYMFASNYFNDLVEENEFIVRLEEDGIESIPYFGNTKGRNDFNECSKMVQIGWNRLDSHTYISHFIASNRVIQKAFNDNYDKKFDSIQALLINNNGSFTFSDVEFYKYMHLINQFEQEVFRTKVREFSSEEDVDVYLFNLNETMELMIRQRFTNCKIVEEEWNEIEIYKFLNRKNADSKIINAFYDWLNRWDGKAISVKEVKEINNISDSYWKKIRSKKMIKGIFDMRNIQTVRDGNNYSLVSLAEND